MYSIDSKPENLTALYLLSHLNQEDIWEYYTGVKPTSSLKVCNPLRDDNHPDCSFYYSSGYWWLNDFAWKKQFNCFTAIMQKYSITYPQALDKVYEEMIRGKKVNLSPLTFSLNVTKVKKKIDVRHQKFTRKDIEFLKSFGISSNTCNKYKVFSIGKYWIDNKLCYTYKESDPCLGYYFGNGEWKMYHYEREDWRFVGNTNKTTLQGYNQLKDVGHLLIITKSYKDVMVYDEMCYSSVAPHSEALSDWDIHLSELNTRFERIYLNFDNDEAGINASNDVVKKHPFITPFFIPKESGEKDISDYVKKYGKNETIKLLKQCVK